MKAWLFQNDKGKGKPWSVGWRDVDRKRREKQFRNKTLAENFRRIKEDELASAAGGVITISWPKFRKELTSKKLSGLALNSVETYNVTLDHWEAIIGEVDVCKIGNRHVEAYVATRRKQRGKTKGSTTAKATLNKELRTLKRVFRVAHRWKYMRDVPTFEWEPEFKTDPTFISPTEFSALYQACEHAKYPVGMPYSAEDWWKAFLLFGYLTGWRVSEIVKLRRDDVDLNEGYAITRSADNKGRREFRVPLSQVLVEHLKAIPSFHVELFLWPNGRRVLWDHFNMLQTKAGIDKTCRKNHPHSEQCKFYGFHDLRRGFATENAGSMSASELQGMMRHSAYATTQKYINMAQQMQKLSDTAAKVKVPDLPSKRKTATG